MTLTSDTATKLRISEAENQKLKKTIVRQEAENALAAAGANIHLAAPILTEGAQVQFGYDGAQVRYRVGNGWGDAADAIAFMKNNHPDAGALFADADRRAVNSVAPVTRNPWRKATWSLTQQMLMQRRSPALAAQMKIEAEEG